MRTLMMFMIGAGLMAGCDGFVYNQSVITKGKVVDKNYVLPQTIRLYTPGNQNAKNQVSVCTETLEFYLVTIESGKTDTVINQSNRSIYIVTPAVFAELEIGKEIDVTGNPNIKLADIK